MEAGDSEVDTAPVDTDNDEVPDYLDTDSDNDGIEDDSDNCRLVVSDNTDTNADGVGDACQDDDDGDGVSDDTDNCPLVANAGQEDSDEDGSGDVCDSSDSTPAFGGDGGCSTTGSGAGWLALLVLAMLMGLGSKKRYTHRAVGWLVAIGALRLSNQALAQVSVDRSDMSRSESHPATGY